MSKRGENIRKRKDGRWEARILDDTRNKYKSIYAKSYSEIKEKVRSIGNVKSREKSHRNIALKDLCKEWLNYTEIRAKQSTVAKYTHTINRHIIPQLGDLKVSEIEYSTINEFIKMKATSGKLDNSGGLSPKTVRDIVSILKQILKFAQANEYIQPINYDFSKPKSQIKELKVLTVTEQEKLVFYLKNNINFENSGILLALYTGIRLGELCALKWEDIDFNTSTIKIRKTIQRIQNTNKDSKHKTIIIIDTPKSINSIREIPIPDFIFTMLYELSKYNSSQNYILTGQKQFIEPRTYQYRFKKILKEAGVSDIKFHALRHTFATRAVEKEIDIKSLSEILGHATVSFTLDRYVHSSMELKKSNIEKLVACY